MSKIKVPRKLCKNCFSPMNLKGGICPVCGYSRGGVEPSVLARGTKLAERYIVGGSIGRGGFGITYLAYDTHNGDTVAVKEYFPTMLAKRGSGNHVIPSSEKNAEQFNTGAEKFFDEAELVRRFNGNPNIVSIYECFYENNTAYYVMEYLDGITLENYVRKYGALNSAQTLYIADKLTMGLVVLHSGAVLHRDISPDNVMLCRDGRVKLIDFGAARKFLSKGAQGYTVIMKTGFSPMEQYSQNTESDTRADIYSLGTLLYYALTGKVPENPYKRMENDATFNENAVKADHGLWSVIGKAAAVAPAERYQNAEKFRDALSELNIGASAIAAPSDYNFLRTDDFTSPNSRQPRSKARIAVILAAVFAAALLLIVFGMKAFSRPEMIKLTLDSEYAGHFNIGGKIPSSKLREFGSDVEITLFIRSWEEKPEEDTQGVIPVNSDDRSVLEYLSSAEDLWADENGWIDIDDGNDSLTFIMSREGIENLGDGGLGFETYNLIVTSAILKPSEKQNDLRIYDFHKDRSAPYTVYDNETGKIITLELAEHRVTDWEDFFETQCIPKSAFYVFDGDVKVTVTLEDFEDGDYNDPHIYVRNCGFCFNVIQKDVLVPFETENGYPPVSRADNYAIHIDKNRKQLILIIPQKVKEKMSSGLFFQCVDVRPGNVRLEAYSGEYSTFV